MWTIWGQDIVFTVTGAAWRAGLVAASQVIARRWPWGPKDIRPAMAPTKKAREVRSRALV